MKPLAILGIVSYKVFPPQMGGQKCVAGFYEALSKQASVTLAVAKENPAQEEPFPVLPFLFNHWKGPLNILFLFKISKLKRQRNIDVIIIEHSYFGWLGVLLRWITGTPFVIRSHNIESYRFRDMQRCWWRLYLLYEGWAHRRADHSFFITMEDMNWALPHWHLSAGKCSVISYGIDTPQILSPAQRHQYRRQLCFHHQIPESTRLFLFCGSFDYLPNTDALRIIITEIIPLLRAKDPAVRIFICGSDLDKDWISALKKYPEIIYTGFVPDISHYWYGTDCFINPVTLGSGLRIKLVEALANGMSCISSASGASGIPVSLTGDKLQVVADYDWATFVGIMTDKWLLSPTNPIPADFFAAFDSQTLVTKALLSLQTL